MPGYAVTTDTTPEDLVTNTKPSDDPEFERLFNTMFDYRRQISDAKNSGKQLDEFWWRHYRDLRDNYRRAAAKVSISDPDAYLEDRYRNYYGL